MTENDSMDNMLHPVLIGKHVTVCPVTLMAATDAYEGAYAKRLMLSKVQVIGFVNSNPLVTMFVN